ncbi:hypothetical protein Tco_0105202 [Tanacetum coccineum]
MGGRAEGGVWRGGGCWRRKGGKGRVEGRWGGDGPGLGIVIGWSVCVWRGGGGECREGQRGRVEDVDEGRWSKQGEWEVGVWRRMSGGGWGGCDLVRREGCWGSGSRVWEGRGDVDGVY